VCLVLFGTCYGRDSRANPPNGRVPGDNFILPNALVRLIIFTRTGPVERKTNGAHRSTCITTSALDGICFDAFERFDLTDGYFDKFVFVGTTRVNVRRVTLRSFRNHFRRNFRPSRTRFVLFKQFPTLGPRWPKFPARETNLGARVYGHGRRRVFRIYVFKNETADDRGRLDSRVGNVFEPARVITTSG